MRAPPADIDTAELERDARTDGAAPSSPALSDRVGAGLAARRLAIEDRDERRSFGRGQTWKHIESWPGGRQVIRRTLQLLGLHGIAERHARQITVRTHELELPDLPERLDGMTLLHLSDLHLDMAPDIPEVIADAVRGLEYDACVLTGDYRAETYGPFEQVLAGFESLMPTLRGPVFGVLGNHDSLRMLPELEALGIQMLMNEIGIIEHRGESLVLAGVDDPHYFRTDDLDTVRAAIPDGMATVLLAHAPDIYARAERAGFEAMLCGHTHGGQLCLPGGLAVISNSRAPRRLCAGPWRHGRLAGYTSVGCGSCVVDLRLNCPPEVTLHRLRRRP